MKLVTRQWLKSLIVVLIAAGSLSLIFAQHHGRVVRDGEPRQSHGSGGFSGAAHIAVPHPLNSPQPPARQGGSVTQPMQQFPHDYRDDRHYRYYYQPNSPYYNGWNYMNRCEMFFNTLWWRYGAAYPDLFPKVRTTEDLYLTKKSIKTALQSSLGEMKELQTNFSALEDTFKSSPEDPSAKKEIKSLSARIRKLASKIREDAFLNQLDLRKDVDVLKDFKALRSNKSSEIQLERLKALIQELKSELNALYDSKTPGVTSVKWYTSASFRSLAKGIEKLAKQIESNS